MPIYRKLVGVKRATPQSPVAKVILTLVNDRLKITTLSQLVCCKITINRDYE